MSLTNFHYLHQNHYSPKTLFLLHGTGGSEYDLIPLVKPLKLHYDFVSFRGNISENGLTRFFKRHAHGVFDQNNLQKETAKLAIFLTTWHQLHKTDPKDTAFLGYSNGANMILATLLYYPDLIHQAALLHPMLPFQPTNINLSDKSLLLTSGLSDPMVSTSQVQTLITLLKSHTATVHTITHPGGHEIHPSEIKALLDFLEPTPYTV